MNIVLVEKNEIQNGRLFLSDRRAEHIIKVLKSKTGERLRIGEIDGRRGEGIVVRLESNRPYLVELETWFTEQPEPRPELDIILALPRPIMLRRILGQLATLGVGTLYLIHSNRVEKSFWQATILEEAEYRGHLLQGLEQAVATRVPRIEIHRRFRPFIEDFYPTRKGEYRYSFVAHPARDCRVLPNIQERGRVIMAIGPEGGWVDFEIAKFTELGFAALSLGTRILKVDTAVIAAHARLSLLMERAGQYD